MGRICGIHRSRFLSLLRQSFQVHRAINGFFLFRGGYPRVFLDGFANPIFFC